MFLKGENVKLKNYFISHFIENSSIQAIFKFYPGNSRIFFLILKYRTKFNPILRIVCVTRGFNRNALKEQRKAFIYGHPTMNENGITYCSVQKLFHSTSEYLHSHYWWKSCGSTCVFGLYFYFFWGIKTTNHLSQCLQLLVSKWRWNV